MPLLCEKILHRGFALTKHFLEATKKTCRISLKHVKMVVPTIVMFGVVPQYFLIWIAWRFMSCLLPSWIYQAGDDMYYSVYQKFVLFFFEHVTGTKLFLYGNLEVISKKERVIYISNHQSTVDWVVVHMLADRQGSTGNVRYVMKDSLQLVPLYGFYFYEHGCVFVKRHYFDSKKMISSLKYLQNEKIPTWMVIFPEGTRYNPEASDMIEKSQSFARDRGLVPLKHVLTPKYKGFQIALEHLKNNLDAVYDATVIYSCTKGDKKTLRTKAPSMFEFVTGCCDAVYIHINRIDMCSIPANESDFKAWLHNIFHKKDRLLDDYYTGKCSPSKLFSLSKGYRSPANVLQHFGCFLFFATLSAPFVLTSYGRSLYWKTWVFGTVFGYFWLSLRSVS
ncbi:1-acyl-sn-glycerol-3-phosphate acyltransferase epsilon [Trichonephila inaurata madagascariensis]|uniref:1-acyl-sn-glycerol-3-phosphate acyltransferase epsilon n=1 Tax=Trichonephila inaurata madagascariensis TaxID=2747483 RepID=A0A8X6XEZ9_9ARAC|nr:1-acyl-sn-glycerol-3-phosphate acyltransferase epsilon [Trichonephila inaurata madagascariensis]